MAPGLDAAGPRRARRRYEWIRDRVCGPGACETQTGGGSSAWRSGTGRRHARSRCSSMPGWPSAAGSGGSGFSGKTLQPRVVRPAVPAQNLWGTRTPSDIRPRGDGRGGGRPAQGPRRCGRPSLLGAAAGRRAAAGRGTGAAGRGCRRPTYSPRTWGRGASLRTMTRSRHSRRNVPITRSAMAFACGARTGVSCGTSARIGGGRSGAPRSSVA